MGVIRRVVVTGIGLVTPLGVGTQHNWALLTAGKIATVAINDPQYAQLPCRVVARIPRGKNVGELDIDSHFSGNELRKMTMASAYALVAAQEALNDANWAPKTQTEKENTGVAVGMGMLDLDDILDAGDSLRQKYSKVSPFFMPRVLANMAAGHISIRHSCQGPNHSVSTACATGAHAVGDSFRLIRSGDADVMVCGGTEAPISALGMAGFCRLRALTTRFNDTPSKASRPFDRERDGFVMGEGAGILVLEELSHALNRGVHIYGEVIGYGLTGDAHHITAPSEDGRGAHRAMTRALKEAQLDPKAVGYVNAHATSTPLGDALEASAISRLFECHSEQLLVSSTKGATGHLLGAAGSVEAAFTVLACGTGTVPPTANLQCQDIDILLDLVPNNARAWQAKGSERRVALCNSFGFGGTNATLCFASY